MTIRSFILIFSCALCPLIAFAEPSTPAPAEPTQEEPNSSDPLVTPPTVEPKASPDPGPPTSPKKPDTPTQDPAPSKGLDQPSRAEDEAPKAQKFIPIGGIAQLSDQADIDLFTKGKSIGHVQDNPSQKFRRLVQRTIMPTEPLSPAGAVLTFDDYLVADSPSQGSAIDIVKDLAPLRTRVIFFANVNGVSGTDVSRIVRKRLSNDAKIALTKKLLDGQKKEFVQTIRELLKAKLPADADGNQEFACEVFNHTAFHQDMKYLKVGTLRYDICVLGIEFVEQCIEEAYAAERPGWKRARYFRFPFLNTPNDKATRAALDKIFTKHGLISLGETQDSKDYDNYNAKTAYRSLVAAKQKRRYNPKYGVYGEAEMPIALFHTKTWKKIKPGVIKAITEVTPEK